MNVPITAVVSSPLTPALIRASGGALADSILHYLTPRNVMGAVAALAAAAMASARPAPPRRDDDARLRGGSRSLVATAFVCLGPVATQRTETRGLHRNAIGAFVETSLARVEPAKHAVDWRSSPFPGAACW